MATQGQRFSRISPLPETIYSLFAIKKAAESAPGVGGPTDVAVIRLGKKTRFLVDKQLDILADIHQRMKPAKLSPDDKNAIREFFS